MTDCATTIWPMRFDTPLGLALETAFDGGRITSDGGLTWLAETDSDLGFLCESLAQHIPEWRRGKVRHSLLTLLKQRVFQIACGYEDQDDSDELRYDPLLKLVCGRLPQTGADLASQPTISRFENAPRARDCYRMACALGDLYIRQRGELAGGAPEKILLDFDSTDDPTHGEQEGSCYHGYYGQHMYHPLLVFDGETGQLVTAILRPGNAHASHEALAILKRIVARLRAAYGPGVEIEIRADAGFAIPAIYEYCEEEGVEYTIGLVTNSRLEALAAPLLAQASEQYQAEKKQQKQRQEEQEEQEEQRVKMRLMDEFSYQAGSWERERRVVYKAEVMDEGTNTRFVVSTHQTTTPRELYEWYVGRGESENWIKDFKLYLKADRLSCSRFVANQFRLLMHAGAYWLMDTLRRRLVSAGVKRMQLDTLRLRLVKIGGRVRQLLTKVRMHLASGHPGQRLWQALALTTEGLHE